MKFSLITPTYNSAATLKDTLESIKAQKEVDLEYIIVDGASKDETAEIVQGYREHIAHFISEPDKGIYDAMNKGVKLATGDVIGILNSDDFYAHGRTLADVCAAFSESHADAVYGNLQYVDFNNIAKVVRHWHSGSYRRANFLYGWMPPHPAFFVRRELYEKHGLYDTSFRTSADYELMLRFLYKHHATAHYLPQVLVKMRTGGISNSSLRHRLYANKEDRRAWSKNGLKPYFYTTLLKPLRKVGQYRFG